MAWKRASFKGKEVWVEVDASGAPASTGGRVPMRYSDKPGAKIYRAGVSNLKLGSGPAVDLEDGVSADAARKSGSSRGSGLGSAGKRTKAQAAKAVEVARELIDGLGEDVAIAYTDGACRGNPGPAGSGVRLELPDGRTAEASRSLGRATNNVGELTAVGIALELLDEAGLPADAPVAVLTDSKYVNGVLVLGWKAKANAELIRDLRAGLKARPGVKLHWVAGHVGVAGNERADALANRGVDGVSSVTWG